MTPACILHLIANVNNQTLEKNGLKSSTLAIFLTVTAAGINTSAGITAKIWMPTQNVTMILQSIMPDLQSTKK